MDKWSLLFSIVVLFVSIGAMIPFINSEYGSDATEHDMIDASEPDQGFFGGASGIGEVLWNIISMFFWTFGALPLYVDLFFVVLRIMFIFLLIDLLWIG